MSILSSVSSSSIVAPLPEFDSVSQSVKQGDVFSSKVSYGIGQTVDRSVSNNYDGHQAQSCVTSLEHVAKLDIYREPVDPRKTSIICTIGK